MSDAPPLHGATPTLGAARHSGRLARLHRRWALELAQLRRPTIESAWASLRGVGHSRNQDAVLAAPPLFAVADGVGGGKAGELASSQMLAWCRLIGPDIWRHAERLAQHLRGADAAVAAGVQALNPGGPSATTFAGVWLGGNGRGQHAHVGDVRILALDADRHGIQVKALTRDQTYAEMGEAAPPGGHAGDPARMVGVGAMGQPPVQAVSLAEGRMLLLCSDGFHRFVSPETLAGHVAQGQRRSWPLERLAQTLAQLAQDGGSHDDVTVLLVRRNPRWGVRRGLWLALAGAATATALALLASAVGGSPFGTFFGGAAGPIAGASTAASVPALSASAPAEPASVAPLPARSASGRVHTGVEPAAALPALPALPASQSTAHVRTTPASAAPARGPSVLLTTPVPSAVAASATAPKASAASASAPGRTRARQDRGTAQTPREVPNAPTGPKAPKAPSTGTAPAAPPPTPAAMSAAQPVTPAATPAASAPGEPR